MFTGAYEIASLYDTERQRLLSFVRRLVGSHSVAEDLVHQAFANLIGSSEREARTNAAFITQTARNLALNHIRDAKRRQRFELAGQDVNVVADTSPTPEMTALHRDELRWLLQAIHRLPPRRRDAFVLSRIEGLSYREVGQRMGIARSSVITHVLAAVQDLDKLLA